MTYLAASDRYAGRVPYRRSGRSGLQLPALSLGLWHNFGDTTPLDQQRALLRTAFDLGINHFDLANNYGPPYGSAETNFGRLFKDDFRPYRDELLISSKAGYDMWPGPYGQGGGSRKYVLASLDQSLRRMGLDYVDIFYSHRFDPDTPLEETAGALATAVRQGKALYVGISSYSAAKTREMVALLDDLKVPLLIHQPSYNMLNRWIEEDLLDVLGETGTGCIAFTPLAQGLLTGKYLNGIPADARINRPGGASLSKSHLSEQKSRARAQARRHRTTPRPEPRANGARVDAARCARDLGIDRGQPARTTRRERRRAREAVVHTGGACRDRPACAGWRREHLEPLLTPIRIDAGATHKPLALPCVQEPCRVRPRPARGRDRTGTA